MRVLVIGGTRFIGLSAVRYLADAGHEVTVFNRGETTADLPDGVSRITGDLWSLEDSAAELSAVRPDVIVHMMLLTADQTRTTLAALEPVTGRLVVVSSGDVYRMYGRINGTEPGTLDPVPVPEDGPLRERRYPYREMADGPDDFRYDYDKIEVEQAALAHPGIEATIVRLPMVYGPRDYQRRLWPYHKRMADGRGAILIDRRMADWRGSRCFVDDAGLAIGLAASAEGGTYNVAEEAAPTERKWIEEIGAACGWTGEVVVVEPHALPESLQEDPHGQDLSMDSSRIRRWLGYAETVSRPVAIDRTIRWDREHPPDVPPFDYEVEDAVLRAVT